MQLNYRVYHIDTRGVTRDHHNFAAPDDIGACEEAALLQAQSEWPEIELWAGIRLVHCKGAAQFVPGSPKVEVGLADQCSSEALH